ncbi:MAG: CBS domain-containing protein, partial [Solimonas sp.]
RAGSVVDLIVRRYAEGSAVTVRSSDTLLHAYRRMKLFDVSQLPVMDDDRLVGILDESDLIQHVALDPARFHDPIATAMVGNIETVAPDAPIADLMPVFARDHVAIVADQGRFVGLITRIDLLNYLRKQLV